MNRVIEYHICKNLIGLACLMLFTLTGWGMAQAAQETPTSQSSSSEAIQRSESSKTSAVQRDKDNATSKPIQGLEKKLAPRKPKDMGRKKVPNKAYKKYVWNRDLGLGGYAGSWGNMPFFGLRGAIPLSPYLAMRVSLSLFFATQREPVISYSGLSVGFLVRLPSFLSYIRNYAVTRIDFWPLWNLLNTNPEIVKVSEKPTFGLSILVGMELFVAQSLSFVLEAGFSSGMIIGFAPIKIPFEAFGFIMQSGLQFYF